MDVCITAFWREKISLQLRYFNDEARINYGKPPSFHQHGGPSRPRQNCHSCIFETRENSNLRICIQYPGGGGYSHTLPIRVCAAQRGRDFKAPGLERGIHFRGVF